MQSAGGGMVGGWIISKSFAKLTEFERQQKVWKLFDMYLSEKDRHRIVGFLTFTPMEKKLAFDDDSDDFTASSKRVRKPITTRGNSVTRRKSMNRSRQTAAAR
ncbi:hypothetical protein L0337_36340 [candidate division KSB1 bacterium]|nr:hypothetical protein [candidate division KSB1 bacterium]